MKDFKSTTTLASILNQTYGSLEELRKKDKTDETEFSHGPKSIHAITGCSFSTPHRIRELLSLQVSLVKNS